MSVGLSPNTGQPIKSESIEISVSYADLSTFRWVTIAQFWGHNTKFYDACFSGHPALPIARSRRLTFPSSRHIARPAGRIVRIPRTRVLGKQEWIARPLRNATRIIRRHNPVYSRHAQTLVVPNAFSQDKIRILSPECRLISEHRQFGASSAVA